MEYDGQAARRPCRFAIALSRLAVLAAAALLLYTCSVCCPQVRQALRGAQDGRAAQAFFRLTDSLRGGGGVAEAFAASYDVLTGADS